MSDPSKRRIPFPADAAAVGLLLFASVWALFRLYQGGEGEKVEVPPGAFHLLMAGVCLGYALLTRLEPVATFHFRMPRRSVWLPTVLMAAGALPVILVASLAGSALLILVGLDFTSDMERMEREVLSLPPVFLTVFPAVGEEILFRGLLLSSLMSVIPRFRGVVYGAALFGAFHILPPMFFHTFLLGLMYGWLVTATGSLWPAVFAHALNNIAALCLAGLAAADHLVFGLVGFLPGLAGLFWGVMMIRRYSDGGGCCGPSAAGGA